MRSRSQSANDLFRKRIVFGEAGPSILNGPMNRQKIINHSEPGFGESRGICGNDARNERVYIYAGTTPARRKVKREETLKAER
jgi:hypothetical protein